MTEAEVWVSPDGVPTRLHYVGTIDEWYPEGPGQRPPACYELRNYTDDGWAYIVTYNLTVWPYEPWSAYDAASDRLLREGWTPPDPEPYVECEHGLSAALCAGPNHYPEER